LIFKFFFKFIRITDVHVSAIPCITIRPISYYFCPPDNLRLLLPLDIYSNAGSWGDQNGMKHK
jgi:hypothetical protein